MNCPRLAHCAVTMILAIASPAMAQNAADVRLVLQLTVDGLRTDLLTRSSDRFVTGGFRYLLDNGTVFTNAHYQHANTETIVGHATLATGAHPSMHGMTGNVWYDAESEWTLLNVESSYRLAHQDDRPYETDLRGFGTTFPHRFGAADNRLLYTQLVRARSVMSCWRPSRRH